MKKAIVITSNLLTEWSLLHETFDITIEHSCISLDVAINNFTRVTADIFLIDKYLPDIDMFDKFKWHIQSFNPEIMVVEYTLRPVPVLGGCQVFKNKILLEE